MNSHLDDISYPVLVLMCEQLLDRVHIGGQQGLHILPGKLFIEHAYAIIDFALN